jgi:hypothetical protein
MARKLITFLITLKYLRLVQIRYRILYFFRKIFSSGRYRMPQGNSAGQKLSFDTFIPVNEQSWQEGRFSFLNLDHVFGDQVDWNFKAHGKLWTYNLNYFDFLLQEGFDPTLVTRLIAGYCNGIDQVRDGLEPYPISLRGINWIKSFAKYGLAVPEFDNCLFRQYLLLSENIEYHLLGNHLMENGFSLLFAAYYFRNEAFYAKAKKIIQHELREQILPDGAHFELSSMYHQIILYRLLDCLNLVMNNNWKEHEMQGLLTSKAGQMLNWTTKTSWKDGSIPLLNDAAYKIAPHSEQLTRYAGQMGIKAVPCALKESGYRKITGQNFELILDAGKIGADYQPGHVHADIFSFEMRVDGKPFIVDTGTSTYERGDRRNYERSTAAHNTVEIDGLNQSEVWASHRVGRRARVKITSESESECIAVHDGYKRIGILHERAFRYDGDRTLFIKDTLTGQKHTYSAVARFHFHPGTTLEVRDTSVTVNNKYNIHFENAIVLVNKEYHYAPEFNKLISSRCIEVKFHKTLKTRIEL